MRTVVAKFGGSSLSDAEQFKKVARIIKSDPARCYVVVSAPGKRFEDDIKVTDLLYQRFGLCKEGKEFSFAEVQSRFDQIVAALGIPLDLTSEFNLIRKKLAAEPQRAFLASRGEYLSARILAAYLNWPFIDAQGVVRFTQDGSLDAEETETLLRSALGAVPNAVIPGFYGADIYGKIHTFSRGGSDITGALVAQAIHASLYENWTDVSGVLMADPRVVEDAKPIAYITYDDLHTLSCHGASVLHADAIYPARKLGIPIQIRNTNRPEDIGTHIVNSLPEQELHGAVSGIAGRKGFSEFAVHKATMVQSQAFQNAVSSLLREFGLTPEICLLHGRQGSFLVKCEPEEEQAIFHAVKAVLAPCKVFVRNHLAMIAIVGGEPGTEAKLRAKVRQALQELRISARILPRYGPEADLVLLLDEAVYEKALLHIYRAVSE